MSELSLTLGRGQVGEYSTTVSFRFRGRLSEDLDKLILFSSVDMCVGVVQNIVVV